MGTHETLSRKSDVQIGSERSFGLVFAAVFAVIGLWPLLSFDAPRLWAIAVSLAFAVVAVIVPGWLKPLNHLWFKFGMLLHKVVTPVILAVVFFLTVTPIGWIMRLLGKDLLTLRFDAAADTYWKTRTPPGPAQGSLQDQF
jgi:predicted membrane metal-binding protein